MRKTKFISTVENLLKANDGMRISEASAPALYRAVSRATMADILDKWNKDQQKAKKSHKNNKYRYIRYSISHFYHNFLHMRICAFAQIC